MANDRTDKRKRRRRSGLLDIVNALLMLVVFGLIGLVALFLYGANQFYSAGAVKADATFTVEKGASIRTTAQRLEEQGLIPPNQVLASEWIFRAGSYGLKKESSLKAGVYQLKAGFSMADVLHEITEGEPLAFFVMVNPGQSSYEVAEALNAATTSLTGDPVPVPPEGSVLPVRHDYFPGDNRADLLKQMQAEMDKAVDAAWAKCQPEVCGPAAPLKTRQDFVILASIVEKETGLASERPLVAGLFINRLRKGIPLQTDPTILYGVFKGVPQADLTITASQKARETPYNTYQIKGLPPTPITNPGEDALAAVANPDKTDYLYMMAKTPGDYRDGHYFARTLDEHNANVRKYRAQEREQGSSAPQ